MYLLRTARRFLQIFLLAAILTTLGHAAQETVLHVFTGAHDGARPFGHLTFDSSGNLYGVTFNGGDHGVGVVYELSAVAGSWNFQVLYTFTGRADGGNPAGPPAFDALGNLYGTTISGGAHSCGTIFRLTPQSGSWVEKVLYSFSCGKDGSGPQDGVVLDAVGNLYGTTFSNGNPNGCTHSGGCGTVFKLEPRANDVWKLKVLRAFLGKGDGANPQAGVTLDPAGNVYGTALGGGHGGFGTVYQLSANARGEQQKFRLLHSFRNIPDGAEPAGAIVFDANGNAYGSTDEGGGSDGSAFGTLFQLVPTPKGLWHFNLLYSFIADNTGGAGDLAIDPHGNLFGGARLGGLSGGIFELLPDPSGTWSYSAVYDFADPSGGTYPNAVILDASGNFYGATQEGGADSAGVVFEVTP